MLLRALPNQIPGLWEAIKFASSKAHNLRDTDLPLYFNRLLQALLNNKAQCFVRIGEGRVLNAILITRILMDEITGSKSLFIESLYSFKSVPDEEWKSDIEVVKKFARNENCAMITTYSNVERVWEILEVIDFKERFRCFVKFLDGGE